MSNLNPTVGPRLNIEDDIRRAWEVLGSGGIAIIPAMGYGLLAGSPAAMRKAFDTKRRGTHKRHALTVDLIGEREIHILDSRKRDMVDCLTVDYDLPVAVAAKYRTDHPLIQKIDPEVLSSCTANGTIATLLNAGPVNTGIGRLAREALHPVFGSSANISGTGTKFRIEDIQPEIRSIADIEIDHGLRRSHVYGLSSTLINFEDMSVIRVGAYYEIISDVLLRHFGVVLPPDPGREKSPHGHLVQLPSFA